MCELLWLQAMCILTLGPSVIVMAGLWELWVLRENLVSVCLHFSQFVFTVLASTLKKQHSKKKVCIVFSFCVIVPLSSEICFLRLKHTDYWDWLYVNFANGLNCVVLQAAQINEIRGILPCGSGLNLRNHGGNLHGAEEDLAGTLNALPSLGLDLQQLVCIISLLNILVYTLVFLRMQVWLKKSLENKIINISGVKRLED